MNAAWTRRTGLVIALVLAAAQARAQTRPDAPSPAVPAPFAPVATPPAPAPSGAPVGEAPPAAAQRAASRRRKHNEAVKRGAAYEPPAGALPLAAPVPASIAPPTAAAPAPPAPAPPVAAPPVAAPPVVAPPVAAPPVGAPEVPPSAAVVAPTSPEQPNPEPSAPIGAPAPSAPASRDDAAGWGTPAPVAPTSAPVTRDDAAGWGTPAPARVDTNDAAGWGAPAAPSGASDDSAGWASSELRVPAPVAVSEATYPRLDARFRDRRGFWLRDGGYAPNASRIAQMRSSLDLSGSYAPSFRVGAQQASFRAVAAVRGEYDMAYRLQRDDQQRKLIDSMPYRIIGQESYLALRIGNFEVKSGRLIMPLGTGEVISSLDLLNPRDLRQPGLVDNENLRLAVLATRASLTLGDHLLEALVVHESFFGLLPPVLGRFSPLRKLLLEDSGSPNVGNYSWHMKHRPERFDPGGTQAIGHYGFTGSGLDLDFYGGSALDQLGVAQRPPAQAFDNRDITLEIYHPRYTLVAHSGAFTAGGFLLRWEIGAQLNRSQTVRRTDSPVLITEIEKRHQVNAMLGLTYFGIPNGVMGLELLQSSVVHNPEREKNSERELLFPVEATNIAFRYAQQLWSERVNFELVALLIGVAPFNGALARADVGYNFRDGLSLHAIYAHYQSSDDFGLLYGFGKNDRLDLSFSWAVGTP